MWSRRCGAWPSGSRPGWRAGSGRTRRGALAVRRTLRRNLALDGLPARLCFRDRRPERTDLVILCDVSQSMRHVARLMLLFLGVLHERAPHGRGPSSSSPSWGR